MTIYFWEAVLIGIFLALKLANYECPKITEIKDQNQKAMAMMTSPLGFAFYYFFLLAILSCLFFATFLRQGPAPVNDPAPRAQGVQLQFK